MIFIQHSSRRYDGLRHEMENNMSKGRDEYPITVTSAYNLMLEWQIKPNLMQGGSIKHKNHLAFAQHNKQGTRKMIDNIKKTSRATSAARSSTTAGNATSKRTNKKN